MLRFIDGVRYSKRPQATLDHLKAIDGNVILYNESGQYQEHQSFSTAILVKAALMMNMRRTWLLEVVSSSRVPIENTQTYTRTYYHT